MKNVNISDRLMLVCKRMMVLDPFITKLELHKKLYFIQAILLTEFKIEAFPEDFSAWMYGPAIETLSEKYRFVNDLRKDILKFKTSEKLDETVSGVIDIIMEEFEEDSVKELVERTRAYSSWTNSFINSDKKIYKNDIVKCHLEIKKEEGFLL
ncbi:MAG: Panacea domain-containing protein [Paraclostridium sp.]|uniref:Panacea domain-containing protein n=1 Tax=Cetobacterium sp. TaxID=2071632 RepID=UPI003F39A077